MVGDCGTAAGCSVPLSLIHIFRVRVNPEDIGRVIGRSGRTANAIRTVVQALSDHKVRVDIMDVRR